jgi:hypothetical protein
MHGAAALQIELHSEIRAQLHLKKSVYLLVHSQRNEKGSRFWRHHVFQAGPQLQPNA